MTQTILGLGVAGWAIVLAVAIMVVVVAGAILAWPGRAGSDDPGPGSADAYVAELRASRLEARSVAELTHYELEHWIATAYRDMPWVRSDAARRRASYA